MHFHYDTLHRISIQCYLLLLFMLLRLGCLLSHLTLLLPFLIWTRLRWPELLQLRTWRKLSRAPQAPLPAYLSGTPISPLHHDQPLQHLSVRGGKKHVPRCRGRSWSSPAYHQLSGSDSPKSNCSVSLFPLSQTPSIPTWHSLHGISAQKPYQIWGWPTIDWKSPQWPHLSSPRHLQP
jgi:hypothetical protein